MRIYPRETPRFILRPDGIIDNGEDIFRVHRKEKAPFIVNLNGEIETGQGKERLKRSIQIINKKNRL